MAVTGVGFGRGWGILALTAVLVCPAMVWARDADAVRILAEADLRRWPAHPFRMLVTSVVYDRQKPGPPAVLVAHARPMGNLGWGTLLRFTAPAQARGRVLLRLGRGAGAAVPGKPGVLPLTLVQPLVGQAALAELAASSWSADYLPVRAGEETISDSDRRQRPCHHLRLQALAANVGYEWGEVWVATDTLLPVKARFFNERGKVVKTIFYRRVREVMGVLRPTEAIIIDGQDTDHMTTIQLDGFGLSTLKSERFHPEHMAEFHED